MKLILFTLIISILLTLFNTLKIKQLIPSQDTSHEKNAIDEEKELDKLDNEVEDALEHEDLNEIENHKEVRSDTLNNEADEEAVEIETGSKREQDQRQARADLPVAREQRHWVKRVAFRRW